MDFFDAIIDFFSGGGGDVAGEVVTEGGGYLADYAADTVSLAADSTANFSDFGWGDSGGGLDDAASTLGGSGTDTAGTGPAVVKTTDVAPSNISKAAHALIDPSGAPDTGSGVGAAETTAAERAFTEGARTAPAGGGGIINNALGWMNKNPTAAAVLGTGVAGAIGGIGKSAMQKEMDERAIRGRKELLAAQTDEQQRLSRAGTFTGKASTSPSGQKVLYRADGSPVYLTGGIINRGMA